MKISSIVSEKDQRMLEQMGMQAGNVGKPAGPGQQMQQQRGGMQATQQKSPQDTAKLRKAKQDQIKAKQQELAALKQELGSIR
jgi:hypothetical protein